MQSPSADILAIAAHRDDVEQTCGGTLLKMRALGIPTAILDLTRGEAGTRGSAEERAAEAAKAAAILGVGYTGTGDPNSGTNYALYAIAAVIIGGAKITGGAGTVLGSLLGYDAARLALLRSKSII